jgi:hypothetical protein
VGLVGRTGSDVAGSELAGVFQIGQRRVGGLEHVEVSIG